MSRIWIATHAALALIAFTATAATEAAGTALSGGEKAEMCARCHGADGRTDNPNLPILAGQNEGYFIKQMKDFRSGYRRSAPMRDVARLLSDEDIADLAAYYGQLK